MFQTMSALILREMRSRFSGDPLGYGWALLNPLAWIGALAVSFSLINRQAPIFTDIISFMMVGILPYIVFRYTITSMMRVSKSSRALLYVDQVTPEIVMFSAALLELFNGLLVYCVVFILNYVIFGKAEAHDVLLMLYGFICAWGTGAAMGYMAAELAKVYEIVHRILPVIMRPVFWISGIFYTANELPESVSDKLVLNPLFQSIEIIRNGAFQSYSSRFVIYYIPIIFMVTLVLGTQLFKAVNKPQFI